MPPVLPAQKISRRLKLLGVAVLAVGLTCAAVVFFTVHPPPVSSQPDEELSTLDSKVDSRALEENQGATGVLLVRFREAMQEPGPLALVIGAASVVISLVCFRAAEWVSSPPEHQSADRKSAGNGHHR